MTSQEQLEIDRWFDACQAAQPKGTLAAMVYVRDGSVNLGRGEVSLESEEFPDVDRAVALELITKALAS